MNVDLFFCGLFATTCKPLIGGYLLHHWSISAYSFVVEAFRWVAKPICSTVVPFYTLVASFRCSAEPFSSDRRPFSTKLAPFSSGVAPFKWVPPLPMGVRAVSSCFLEYLIGA